MVYKLLYVYLSLSEIANDISLLISCTLEGGLI